MELRKFDKMYFDGILRLANRRIRKRQSENLHSSYAEPCQRLFNALTSSTYIPPHRHALDPKMETLVAIKGSMAVLIFDDLGHLVRHVFLQPFNRDEGNLNCAVAVEIPPDVWHTVVALSPECVLFEVKSGPFYEDLAKELAPWAPAEDSPHASSFLQSMKAAITKPVRAQK